MNENTARPAEMGIWSRHYISLISANFFVALCMNFHTAVTTLYVVSLGGSATYAGLLLTCFTLAGFFTRIVSGKAVDKRGRRRIINSGLIIYAVATIAITLPWLPAFPFIRAVQAIGYSMASTGITVAVTDVIPLPKMNEGIGYSGLVESLSSAVGPGFALWLYGLSGNYTIVYYASVVMMLLAFGILFLFRYEDDSAFFERKHAYEQSLSADRPAPEESGPAGQDEPDSNKGFLSGFFEKKALPSMVTAVFYSFAMGAKIAYLVLFAQSIGIENAGLFYTLEAVTTVVARLLCGKLADRYGALAVLLPGFLCTGLCYFLLTLAPANTLCFFAAGVVSGLGHGIIYPTLHAEAVRKVPQKRRGAAVATYMISFDMGIGLGGLFWGAMIDRTSFRGIFLGCMLCIAVSLILCFVFFSRRDQRERAQV